MNAEDALAIWRLNHREATKVLSDFAKGGDVDWDDVLNNQRSFLDDVLARQDRRLSRYRAGRHLPV